MGLECTTEGKGAAICADALILGINTCMDGVHLPVFLLNAPA